ncbi:MAG: trypsin-like peptidase domain-containing protein [Pseudomonadota bacterium]
MAYRSCRLLLGFLLGLPICVALSVADASRASSNRAPQTLELPALVRTAAPAVVGIEARLRPFCGRSAFDARGSGVIVRSDGVVLTNLHVVRGAQTIAVRMHSGALLAAELIATDARTDLALLRVAADDLPVLRFAPEAPEIGTPVVALGTPLTYGLSATAGIVSGLGRSYDDVDPIPYVQHDAAINPGNSGGPLLDMQGRILGINTAIPDPATHDIGIALAIPATMASRVTAHLLRYGHVRRGWLGLTLQQLDPKLTQELGLAAPHAVAIVAVAERSPADLAGVRPGDILLSTDGQPVATLRDHARIMERTAPGTAVRLTLDRPGAQRRVSVRAVAPPMPNHPAQHGPRRCRDASVPPSLPPGPLLEFGALFQPSIPGARPARPGVVLAAVQPGKAAARSGLRAGDVILAVGRLPVSDPQTLQRLLDADRNDMLVLLVQRPSEGPSYLVVPRQLEPDPALLGNVATVVRGPY